MTVTEVVRRAVAVLQAAVLAVGGTLVAWAHTANIAPVGEPLVVCESWDGDRCHAWPQPIIAPGSSSAGVITDADGYWLGPGCTDGSNVGPGWVKVPGRFGGTVRVDVSCPDR